MRVFPAMGLPLCVAFACAAPGTEFGSGTGPVDLVDDDDAGPADDDDGGPADDDDDADGATTRIRILDPSPDEVLRGTATAVAEADGASPGRSVWRLDGVELAVRPFPDGEDRVELPIDTLELPDGEAVLRVELPDWGLSDSVPVRFDNGDLIVLDLGSVRIGSGESATFDVPDSAVSVQIQVDVGTPQPSGFGWLGGALRNPSNLWAVTPGLSTALYEVWPAGGSPFAAGVPSHASATWETGEYRLWAQGNDEIEGLDAELTALVKRAFAEPSTGTLALDLYFTPNAGLSAAEASTSAAFWTFLDAVEGTLGQAGIGLGDVRFFDLPNESMDRLDSWGEFGVLLARSEGGDARVLNLFFVQDIAFGGGAGLDVLGVASHTPGPALVHGSTQSGVAMELGNLTAQPLEKAHTASHEIGHFLGLQHTSEVGGTEHDSIADTPVSCDSVGCWATNLMDPYRNGATNLTSEQSWVLLRHPLVVLDPPGARRSFPPPPPGPADGRPFCGARR